MQTPLYVYRKPPKEDFDHFTEPQKNAINAEITKMNAYVNKAKLKLSMDLKLMEYIRR